MAGGIFHILGTDTGAGKTHVTSLLLEGAGRLGVSALPLKPVHSGWRRADEWGEDLRVLRPWIPAGLSPGELCRYALEAPISPFSAAREAGQSIEIAELLGFLERARRRPERCLLVEGVGGVCCPLGPRLTYLEFLSRAPGACLLVSRVGLGALNHAVMSARLLTAAGKPPIALVLNEETEGVTATPAGRVARGELENLLDVPVFGPLLRDRREQNLAALEPLARKVFLGAA